MSDLAKNAYCLFVAIPIDVVGTERVSSLVQPLQAQLPLLRWLDAATWHITLAYVGDCDVAVKNNLTEIITHYAHDVAAMQVPVESWVQWPVRRPRVLALRLMDHLPLLKLRADMVAAMVDAGINIDHQQTFLPHLSVARFKPSLQPDMQGLPQPVDINLKLERIELWHSQKKPNTPYQSLCTVALNPVDKNE